MIINEKDKLAEQNLETLDVTKLTPLSEDVISRQATINLGTIGHVAHGKSTLVHAISGVHTVRFKHEKERNITIKLGYANAKIYKCTNPDCPPPECYKSYESSKEDDPMCPRENCNSKMKLLRHVSFVDCPGHDILMATMLNGAAVMDAALLLVAGNESCPQPQTSEHLAAVEIMRLKHILILQNKVELIKEEQALKQQEEIRNFVSGTAADSAPIIPISAVLKYNIDVVCEYIVTQISIPRRDFISSPHMIVIRSFDVNKPGGLIGVGTRIDPILTRADRLVGQVIGHLNKLPDCFAEIEISYYLLRRLLGVKSQDGEKNTKVAKLKNGEFLMINIGSTSIGCRVMGIKNELAKLELTGPVCTKIGDKIALSRRVDKHWRLIGWGQINKGKPLDLQEPI